ncbi:hypothetical protein NC653_022265 [Populus alba x Populus x berolinensis]|uniref:Uncharacterized protein n=1 Tax=Populus alba x Populus x berolinensis TaxID=444605 RepID=A0AAD6Q9K9_9ROSI|nr:hypothetical protein NC653_022265 [Populus alba x Populus x berolinensis]
MTLLFGNIKTLNLSGALEVLLTSSTDHLVVLVGMSLTVENPTLFSKRIGGLPQYGKDSIWGGLEMRLNHAGRMSLFFL